MKTPSSFHATAPDSALFKSAAEMQSGIASAVVNYLYRAKVASEYAARCLAQSRSEPTNFGPLLEYQRYRAQRHDWIAAARILLSPTTNGIAVSNVQARRYARAAGRNPHHQRAA